MDAAKLPEIVAPFMQIDEHLRKLGFSAPEILAHDRQNQLLLLEDFGNETFAGLLPAKSDELFALATDVLIALHTNPKSILERLRIYSPEKMLADVELFLDWCAQGITGAGKSEFRKIWRDILPIAHQVPASLLLRDYHVANLMFLPVREGIRRAGILDFQDAYTGPITYDLVSLLEDARRDVPDDLRAKMFARYLAAFPSLDRKTFETSAAILAALRHTRVLAVFEKLSREGKPDYKKFHSPHVEQLLQNALRHPILGALKNWLDRYVR